MSGFPTICDKCGKLYLSAGNWVSVIGGGNVDVEMIGDNRVIGSCPNKQCGGTGHILEGKYSWAQDALNWILQVSSIEELKAVKEALDAKINGSLTPEQESRLPDFIRPILPHLKSSVKIWENVRPSAS